nr:sugar phosphate isomerase/epimerase [Armatimonadota bacterium]
MNKLAFSTLGCPEWSLDRILKSAREWGYDALELRGLQEQIDLPLAEPFLPQNRQTTRRQFED